MSMDKHLSLSVVGTHKCNIIWLGSEWKLPQDSGIFHDVVIDDEEILK